MVSVHWLIKLLYAAGLNPETEFSMKLWSKGKTFEGRSDGIDIWEAFLDIIYNLAAQISWELSKSFFSSPKKSKKYKKNIFPSEQQF